MLLVIEDKVRLFRLLAHFLPFLRSKGMHGGNRNFFPLIFLANPFFHLLDEEHKRIDRMFRSFLQHFLQQFPILKGQAGRQMGQGFWGQRGRGFGIGEGWGLGHRGFLWGGFLEQLRVLVRGWGSAFQSGWWRCSSGEEHLGYFLKTNL